MAKKSSSNSTVSISEKPKGRVTISKPVRDGGKFQAKWKLPSAATDKKEKGRWESQGIKWTFEQILDGKPTAKYTKTGSITMLERRKLDIKQNYVAKKRLQYNNACNEYDRATTQEAQAKALKKKTRAKKAYDKAVKAYHTLQRDIENKHRVYTYVPTKAEKEAYAKTESNFKKSYNEVLDITKKKKNQTGQKTVIKKNLGAKATAHTVGFEFDSYHPKISKRYLKRVRAAVYGQNTAKKGTGDLKTSSWYVFHPPKDPTVSGVSFNEQGRLSVTVKSATTGGYHRYWDTRYITRIDNITVGYKAEKVVPDTSGTVKTTEYTYSYDFADWAGLTYDQWARFTFCIKAQGCRGDSKLVKKSYTVAYPAVGVIKKIHVIDDKDRYWDPKLGKVVVRDSGQHNGSVVVDLAFTDKTNHPVDTVKLQRVKTQADTLAKVAELQDNDWEDIYTENGKVNCMSEPLGDAWPAVGLHVWYRLVTVHGPFERKGAPYEASELFHGPSKPGIIEALSMDNGVYPTSIRLTYGFKEDQADGTQIEWSDWDILNALKSNKGPETYDDIYVLSKDTATDIAKSFGIRSGTYDYIEQFYIRDGIEEGESYWIAAARYAETEDGRILSDRAFWENSEGKRIPVIFGMKPRSVSLNVPAGVPVGKTYTVSWGFDSEYPQDSYILYYMDGEDEYILRSETESSTMSTVLTEDEIATATVANRVTLRVSVTAGGLTAKSGNGVTYIQDPPEVKLELPSGTLTTQPVKIGYTATQDGLLLLTMYADGCNGEIIPGVDIEQAHGDVVHSVALSVTQGTGEYNFPAALELHHLSAYNIVGSLINTETKLSSGDVAVGFTVNYTRRAMPAGDGSVVEVDTDAKTATIIPFKPENYVEACGDVCDVYRITPDGPYLIKKGASFGTKVVDPYAPYSKTANSRYTIVTRTLNGDTAYKTIAYRIPGYKIRFDWGRGRVLEVPYNLRMNDGFTKDFEARAHLDGTITGGWNPAVQRKATLNTDLIRLEDPEQKELVRELAQYPGSVFVRTPDGCAYEADVQVTTIQNDYDSLVLPVTFNATEIDLGPEFMVPVEKKTEDVAPDESEEPTETEEPVETGE